MFKQKILFLTICITFSLIFLGVTITPSYSIQNEKLLYWHYNDAKWWSEGKISDEKFQKSLIVLLESNTDLSQNNSEDLSIPTWYSNSAQWFSENKITSDVYVSAITFLYDENLLKIPTSSIIDTNMEYSSKNIPLIQTFEKNVDLFSASLFTKDVLIFNDGSTKYLDVQFDFVPENSETYESLINSSNSVVVIPTFTFTAYTEPGFYTFYRGDCDQEFHGVLFRDDDCLTTPINYNKPVDFTASTLGLNILHLLDYPLITDIDVDKNPEILQNYDKVILLHNEYVTKQMFDAITSHPNVVYLYPNALYAEIDVNYDDDTISLIRGHNYPDPLIRNGFDWIYDNSLLEYNLECVDWKFEPIPNGHMLNCYPEYAMYSDELLLKTLNEL